MPSSWSASLRFELQFTGENINTWGDKLNAVFQHVDYGIAGWLTKALTGNYALTSANAADDEARAAMLKFTGAGPFTVTIPAVPKSYKAWNACSAATSVTTGSGAVAVLQPGERCELMCDGTNVYRIVPTDFGGQKITGLGAPTAGTDGATKAYVDAAAFSAAAGNLPGQVGNAGKALFTDGANPSWTLVTPALIGAASSIAPTITGGMDLSGGLKLAGSTKLSVNALAALDIDFSAADVCSKTINVNSTFTYSNFTAGKAQVVLVDLTISGGAVPTWPAATKYANGAGAPTLGNGRHLVSLISPTGSATDVTLVVTAKNIS